MKDYRIEVPCYMMFSVKLNYKNLCFALCDTINVRLRTDYDVCIVKTFAANATLHTMQISYKFKERQLTSGETSQMFYTYSLYV